MSERTDMNWRVLKYDCPILGREISEIWAGPVPSVSANVYLRRLARLRQWADATVSAIAYRLVVFFRWLDTEGLSFWPDEVR